MNSQQQPQFLPHSSPDLTIADNVNSGFSNGQQKVMYSAKRLQNINCILQPTEKQGGVYLGDVVSTIKQDLIRQYQIRAIMTCMSENVSITSKVAFHKIIPIKDLYDYPIINHFDESIQWIDQKRNQKINILVHCHAGVSRSATVVIAYLIRTLGWNPLEALKFVQQRRERVKPNASFWAQLNEYYNYWRNQNLKLGQIVPLQKPIAQTLKTSPSNLQNLQHQKAHLHNISADMIIQHPLNTQQRGNSKSIQRIMERKKVDARIQHHNQELKQKKEKLSLTKPLKFADKKQIEKTEAKIKDQSGNGEYFITPKHSQKSSGYHTNSSCGFNTSIQTQRYFNPNRPSIEPKISKRIQNGEQKLPHNNSSCSPLPHQIHSYRKPEFIISNEIHSSPFLSTFSGISSHRYS